MSVKQDIVSILMYWMHWDIYCNNVQYFFHFYVSFIQVQFFCNIGGFNVKESINLYWKESTVDNLALSFTWWGRKGKQPLHKTLLVRCIYGTIMFIYIYAYLYAYLQLLILIININKKSFVHFLDAVCKNKFFPKPTKSEFQRHMIDALRAAKERVRSRSNPRGSRVLASRENDSNFWNDENEAESTEENEVISFLFQ